MPENKLLPCPFCGSKNVRIENNFVPCVRCRDCFAIVSYSDMPPGVTDDTALIEKWNRRAGGKNG